jgi:hypothetical protein
VSFEAALRALYPQAMPVAEFADLATQRLAPFGFAPGNFLPLIGMCRDELMFDVEHELQQRWGSGFDMSSLAAMVLLGRSGIEAATHHAPDDAGLRRYVIVLLPHIGIDADGSIGAVRRDGQLAASTACGALAKIHAEMLSGRLDLALDRHDLEIGLVRMELLRRITYGETPDLPELTEIARAAAVDEMTLLASEMVRDVDSDVALLSGVVIHGPDGDWVQPAASWLGRAGTPTIPLSLL